MEPQTALGVILEQAPRCKTLLQDGSECGRVCRLARGSNVYYTSCSGHIYKRQTIPLEERPPCSAPQSGTPCLFRVSKQHQIAGYTGLCSRHAHKRRMWERTRDEAKKLLDAKVTEYVQTLEGLRPPVNPVTAAEIRTEIKKLQAQNAMCSKLKAKVLMGQKAMNLTVEQEVRDQIETSTAVLADAVDVVARIQEQIPGALAMLLEMEQTPEVSALIKEWDILACELDPDTETKK